MATLSYAQVETIKQKRQRALDRWVTHGDNEALGRMNAYAEILTMLLQTAAS